MPDDFDSVIAELCRAFDDAPVPSDLWSRAQSKVLDRAPDGLDDHAATLIELESRRELVEHGDAVDAADPDDGGRRRIDRARVDSASRRDSAASGGGDAVDAPVELATADVVSPTTWRAVGLKVGLAVAAAAVLIVALAAITRIDDPTPADVPQSTVPTSTSNTSSTSPSTVPTTSPSTVPTTSPSTGPPSTSTPSMPAELPAVPLGPATEGEMWPQSTLDQVRAAQEGADAGDPAYTWQVDPRLSTAEWTEYAQAPGFEIVERFLLEGLGWEEFMFNPYIGDYGCCLAPEGFIRGVVYMRCGPGRTNPLYPPHAEAGPAELCAPTLDDHRYETVKIDLAQPDRHGPEGVWVVNDWEPSTFTQADPADVEARALERLEEFLAARVAGEGAEGYVQVEFNTVLPLIYGTSSGAPYERFEIERVGPPGWPDGHLAFVVRLFADGGDTVVEQLVRWHSTVGGGLLLDATSTTENGEPIITSFASEDGEVSASAPVNWRTFWPGVGPQADVWFGILWSGPQPYYETEERIELVDPVAYDGWCAENGGTPMLTAPAGAAAIAQQVVADPNFETTEPVVTSIGGVDAISIDVALAPGGRGCGIGMIEIARWIHSIHWNPNLRLRLYLVDLPRGMTVETLAITVVAPAERFDDYLVETEPIIDSIEFHPSVT